jgi:hypothetical protein
MRQLVILLGFSILIAACSSKNKIPKDILPKQEMEDVLWDLLRGSEFLEIYRFSKDSSIDKAAKAQEWYDEIFRLHKTNRPAFEKSYTWYQHHPEIMKEVLDSLSNKTAPDYKPPGQSTIDSLAIKTDSARTGQDSAHKNQDSLQKPLIRTGQRPDDTFAVKAGNIRTRKDSPGTFQLPGLHRRLNPDSVRKIRAGKLPG